MALGDRIFEALRANMVLGERIRMLADKVERLNRDVRGLDGRLIRIETLVEVATTRPRIGRDGRARYRRSLTQRRCVRGQRRGTLADAAGTRPGAPRVRPKRTTAESG